VSGVTFFQTKNVIGTGFMEKERPGFQRSDSKKMINETQKLINDNWFKNDIKKQKEHFRTPLAFEPANLEIRLRC